MNYSQLISDSNYAEELLLNSISSIHQNGPILEKDLQILAIVKYKYPDLFKNYENKILYILGLFYKTEEPTDIVSLFYNSYKDKIISITGKTYTPIQAQIYSKIKDNTVYSFSAPTSAGKSFLLRDIIDKCEEDVVIIVPSRSLISEYLILLREHYENNTEVLILEFVDDINRAKTKRRIFVLTPERLIDLFKFEFKVELFIFDEAQLADDKKRGINFERIVKKCEKKYPESKKIFAHPFVENPGAIYDKFNLHEDKISNSFNQRTVGKIYILRDKKEKYYYINPLTQEGTYKKNRVAIDDGKDFISKLIINKKTVLIYLSKHKIVTGEFENIFRKYISLCPDITNPEAIKIIETISQILDVTDEKESNIVKLLKKGIVVHHGSIPLNVRYWLEKFIKIEQAKICFSTSTLIYGINMPFDAIYIDNFRFDGTEDDKSLQMKNLIGRAGRTKSTNHSFEYGFVVINESSLSKFKSRLQKSANISPYSVLDQSLDNIDTVEKENILAEKEDMYSDEYNEPLTRIERLKSEYALNLCKEFIDILFKNSTVIRDEKSFTQDEHIKVQQLLLALFERYINRKILDGEKNIFSTGLTILLWIMQGESFKKILNKRYVYLTNLNERRKLKKQFETGIISEITYKTELAKIKIEYSASPCHIPDKKLLKVSSSFKDMNCLHVDYDSIVYDTYDYIDKVVEFSLLDVFITALTIYKHEKGDNRADAVIECLKYGTNNSKSIMLRRYGFSDEEIDIVNPKIISIDDNQIVFNGDFSDITDELLIKKIKRYV